MGDELSSGQARDCYTHTHTRTHRPTDAGDDNTRRPKLASGKKGMWLGKKCHTEGFVPKELCSFLHFMFLVTDLQRPLTALNINGLMVSLP